MIKKVFWFTPFLMFCACILFSCSDDEQTKDILNLTTDSDNNISVEQKSDEILSEKAKLLNEIDLCGNKNDSCVLEPKFFPLHEFKEMSSGFALRFHHANESNKRKMWKTFVYVRKDEELKCINKFQGPIMANDTNKIDFPDLLIRLTEFNTNKRFFYNCWFKYNVDKIVYEFDYCDLIHEKPITNSMSPKLIFDHYAESPKKRKEMNDKLRLKLKNQGLY